MKQPDGATVAFDIGGVLIDWNPRHMYRKIFGADEAAMERFLTDVCTPAWNARLDAGRPFAEAIAELIREHPGETEVIEAYASRWEEMLGGAFEDSVQVMRELRSAGVPVYALSNWSKEKFTVTRKRFTFLDEFDGILISGEVGVGKPDPAIFREFLDRFGLVARSTVFIDDSPANVTVARTLGIDGILFENADQLRARSGEPRLPARDSAGPTALRRRTASRRTRSGRSADGRPGSETRAGWWTTGGPAGSVAGFAHQCNGGIDSVRVGGSTSTSQSRGQRDQRKSQTQDPGDDEGAEAEQASEHRTTPIGNRPPEIRTSAARRRS